MTPKDVIIVGNGLFGSIAATLCRSRGHNVTVVSNNEPMAASKASGCVLAPSWLTSLNKTDVDHGLRLLDELYGLQDVVFTGPLGAPFKAQRVDPDRVRVKADVTADVTSVKDGAVALNDGRTLRGTVLVAAGVWCGRLVEMPPIRGLYGASMRFKATGVQAKISVYAPYRQSVLFQLNKTEAWGGDGTALIRKTWEAERDNRIAATVQRITKLSELRQLQGVKVTEGIRPYVEEHKAGFFKRISPRTFVSTGGAKNGTLLAAAQALRFVEEGRL